MKLSCAGWRRWTNDHTGGCAQLRSYGNKFRTFHPRYRKFESIPLRHAVSVLRRTCKIRGLRLAMSAASYHAMCPARAIGTEFLALREKIEVTPYDSTSETLSFARGGQSCVVTRQWTTFASKARLPIWMRLRCGGETTIDVFDLDRALVQDYERFARSFTQIRAADIRAQLEAIYASRRFWPEPLVSINPNFERDIAIDTLVADEARCRGPHAADRRP
jgi:hypothetical protein